MVSIKSTRNTNKAQIFDGKKFLPIDSANTDFVNFITFRVNIETNTLECQFVPTGNKEDVDENMWVAICDMGVTSIEALKNKLQALIEECRILSNSVPQGMDINMWKPSVVVEFNNQINTAEIPLLTSNPTVLKLSEAYNKLLQDKINFENSKNTVVSLIKDGLWQLIQECEQIYSAAQTAEGIPGMYDPNDKAVFRSHIDIGLYVYRDITATKAQVETEIEMLTLARDNFLKSKDTSSNVNAEQLRQAVNTAEALIQQAKVLNLYETEEDNI